MAVRARLSPEARHRQLVVSTLSVLRERPPQDVVADDIADAAGVSRGLVYRYFEDLDGLFVAAYEEYFRPLEAALEDVVRSACDPSVAMLQVMEAYLEFARADPSLFRHLVDGGLALRPEVRRARTARLKCLSWLQDRGAAPSITAVMAAGIIETAIIAWLDSSDDDASPTSDDGIWLLAWSGLSGLCHHYRAAWCDRPGSLGRSIDPTSAAPRPVSELYGTRRLVDVGWWQT